MSSEWTFKCKTCGSDRLVVERYINQEETYTRTLPCRCGHAAAGIASYYAETVVQSIKEWGYLDESHHVEWEDSDELDTNILGGEDEIEINCQECHEKYRGDPSAWQQSESKYIQDEDSLEIYVRCIGCDREIEFGWSHPDKGGRIWPAECSDFKPHLSIPEDRYIESWKKKNWLHHKSPHREKTEDD